MSATEESSKSATRPFLSSIQIRFLRHVVQGQFLILFMYGVTRPDSPESLIWGLDPVQGISASLLGYGLSCAAFVAVSIMVLASAVMGRAFCGWLCPVGLVQDVASLRGIGYRTPRWLRLVKYALLAGGLFSLIALGWTFLGWLTPLSLFTRSVTPLFWPGLGIQVGTLILVASMVFTILSDKRAWCRYVCPTGALLSLLASRKLVGIGVDEGRCIQCQRCEDACSMGVCEAKGHPEFKWENECVLCLSCRDACPTGAMGIEYRV